MEDNKLERVLILDNDDFKRLAQYEDRYEILIDALINCSTLSYSGDHLSFDTGVVDILLKTFENYIYEKRLSELKAEKEQKE